MEEEEEEEDLKDGIVKHGKEKRSIETITCDREKTSRTLWREENSDEIISAGRVEEEIEKRRRERRAREKEEVPKFGKNRIDKSVRNKG